MIVKFDNNMYYIPKIDNSMGTYNYTSQFMVQFQFEHEMY